MQHNQAGGALKSAKQNRTLSGIRVGHATDRRGLTGVTVILCERGAVNAVDVRGGASGTRDLETCRPGHIAERAHAVLLTGGSAFGLDSAAGVMRYLESRGVGFAAAPARVPPICVPIVPAACIFDLNVGSSRARPDAAMALAACRAAAGPGGRFVREGSVGAGTGATVGKINGIACAMKGGVGFYSLRLGSNRKGQCATVQALAVVNAFGDVLDPGNGKILAGARRSPRSAEFVGATAVSLGGAGAKAFGGTNTTLVVIMTDAGLDKSALTKVAQMAHDGFAHTISPVHTRFDGDLAFALSLGNRCADLNAIGAAAADATAQAIVRAVTCARGLGGVLSLQDLARMRK